MTRNPKTGLLLTPTAFRDRFAIASFEDSGVLLDLATGTVYRLNAVAVRICAALARGETLEQVEQGLAQTFDLARATAARDVRAVLAGLETDAAGEHRAGSTLNPISFEADEAGFLLRWKGEAVLRIDPSGCKLTYQARPPLSTHDVALHLQWAVPHLLALQHQPVLHASAVQWEDGVHAFCGASGAGKTTLARLFAAHGARLISEDLLPITVEHGAPVAFVEGEVALRRWVTGKSAIIAAGGPVDLDTSALAEVVSGPTLPLREILFVDAARRLGNTIATEPLDAADALVLLLGNGFAELEQRGIWVELLETSRAIVVGTAVRSATLPTGLAALQVAVRAYSATSTS